VIQAFILLPRMALPGLEGEDLTLSVLAIVYSAISCPL